jgi:hypothetical protein
MEMAPGRATVHRVLVLNGLVQAQEQEHKRTYRRWQREAPMHLWQLDPVGGVPLADGRECKMVTGIDDHSRFVAIAAVVAVPSGRSVCSAFTAAMRRYGVPFKVLTDNGKQFTGRHIRPRPVEVLFEQTSLTHHDQEDQGMAQDPAHGAARPRGAVRIAARRPGSDRRVGAHLQPLTAASGAEHGHLRPRHQ